MNILFITEKWCDANPFYGLTNSYHNIFGSFKRSSFDSKHKVDIIHYDECMVKKNIHIDVYRDKIWDKFKPDLIVCTLLGNSPMNPSKEFFRFFKEKGTKNVFIWPDIGAGWGINQISEFCDVTYKNIAWASEKNIKAENLEWLWTPEDPSLFYFDEKQEKDIDICFLGTVHNNERYSYISQLQSSNLGNVLISGGQRSAKLSETQYAECTRRSKIIVNFPFSPSGGDQLKGRVFESTACGGLLLERKNEKTSEFYNEDEYVSYTTPEDLIEKCRFYLNNDEERKKIALKGWQKYNSCYSAEHYWKKFFDIIS